MYILKIEKEQFKKLLKETGCTQKSLALEIGVDRTYISQMVGGRRVSKLCAYAICKGISPDLEIENLFEKI